MDYLYFSIILLILVIGILNTMGILNINTKKPIAKHKITYEEELSDQRWKAKRERILKRDGYKCCWCGSRNNLQVHHRYYEKYPDGSRAEAWDYPDSALMILCDNCHKKCHSKYKIKIYRRKHNVHYEN